MKSCDAPVALGRRIGRHLQALQGFLSLFTLQHNAGVDDFPELLAVTDGIVLHTRFLL